MPSINVKGYGSMVNAIGNQTQSKVPKVGIGVTELMYSDRHPYTVTEILSEKRIKVRRCNSKRIDNNGFSESQDYEYTEDLEAPEIELFLNKFGRWKERGHADGSTFLIGRREEYYDFTR